MSNTALAIHIARKVFELGNEGPRLPAVRLEYKIGSLDNELAGGGFIESSFAKFIEKLLDSADRDGLGKPDALSNNKGESK